MFQTTRRRLALWYTTVTAVLLLVFAGGFYGYVRLTLIDRIDDTITHVAEVLERAISSEQPAKVGTRIPRLYIDKAEALEADRIDADHIDIEWFSPLGEILWSTMPELPPLPLDPKDFTSPKPTYRTVYVTPTEPLRQMTEPIVSKMKLLGYLRVSHPWFEVTKPIQQLFLDLTIGITATIVVVALCGWWLSGIAMEPVRESYQRLKQFTADASHELRNPVAVIQTNVQVALADPNPNWQNQQHQLEVIERLTRRLSRLLDDLLFLARQDGGLTKQASETCPLDRILQEVIEEQQVIASAKNVSLSASNTEMGVNILGDKDQLTRLFTNLVSNAVNYTPPGGEVQIVPQLLTAPDRVQIQIRDTGIGIPTTALPHIFDRFYRYQPQSGGQSTGSSGLGLAIAKAITDKHHGQIKVESFPGVGTTFTVTLPQARAK